MKHRKKRVYMTEAKFKSVKTLLEMNVRPSEITRSQEVSGATISRVKEVSSFSDYKTKHNRPAPKPKKQPENPTGIVEAMELLTNEVRALRTEIKALQPTQNGEAKRFGLFRTGAH